MRLRFPLLAPLVLLAGCAVGPNYRRPDTQTPAAYRAALAAAGCTIAAEQSRKEGALAFFAAQRARAAAGGVSPLNLGLVLGPTGPAKLANMVGMITRGLIAPYEIIARRD